MTDSIQPVHKRLSEARVVLSLASIFSFRLLGLFIILPVFAIYAHQFNGATSFLIGFALGVYGLTQACLQMPFGALSDRIGRKPVILIGLFIFVIGSMVAALSTSITGIIIGRALQGAGAVGSTILALLADLIKVENRTKAMGLIGMSIGVSFMLAIIIGPVLSHWIGLSGLFWMTALFGVIGMLLLAFLVPSPKQVIFHRDIQSTPKLFRHILKDRQLIRLDLSILISHAILTASFVAIPLVIKQLGDFNNYKQVLLYLPVMLGAFILATPFIIFAEKKRQIKMIFICAIIGICLSQGLLYFLHHSLVSLILLMLVFFTSFTLLEAILPSWVAKIAPMQGKGTAIGVYSTSQFFGIFLGGSLGGWVYSHYQVGGVFSLCFGLAVFWLLSTFTIASPPYLKTLLFEIGDISPENAGKLSQALQTVAGVKEAAIALEEGIAYLKVDGQQPPEEGALRQIIDCYKR